MGTQQKKAQLGYTIIEVMLFFGVTGALMAGILASATVGVNSQRYNDAVNTFTSIVQQEFTKAANVSNEGSSSAICSSLSGPAPERGVSDCVIIGRLLTVAGNGDMVHSNIVGKEPATPASESARIIEVFLSYDPAIDTTTQEASQMNWQTTIQRGAAGGSNLSLLILRSPRTGNIHSYVLHSGTGIISSTSSLRDEIDDLDGAGPALNSSDQYMCIDRANWVVSPVRAVKIAPYSSGPSGVSSVETSGSMCG